MFTLSSPRADARPQCVGMVHLLPLPGGPHESPGLPAVRERALLDASRLAAGGVDAILIENLGDAPFAADDVEAFTIAAMTDIVGAIRHALPDMPLGVNVLRNDGSAAMAIATATGAAFIRVNVWVGTMATDQGLITGKAREILMQRQRLNSSVEILADVHVKHAVPIGPASLVDSAKDTFLRGRANGLILTGTGTGTPTDPSEIETIRQALPQAPLWVGSGVTPETLPFNVEGVIVGTWLHEESDLRRPIDPSRVSQLVSRLNRSSP